MDRTILAPLAPATLATPLPFKYASRSEFVIEFKADEEAEWESRSFEEWSEVAVYARVFDLALKDFRDAIVTLPKRGTLAAQGSGEGGCRGVRSRA